MKNLESREPAWHRGFKRWRLTRWEKITRHVSSAITNHARVELEGWLLHGRSNGSSWISPQQSTGIGADDHVRTLSSDAESRPDRELSLLGFIDLATVVPHGHRKCHSMNSLPEITMCTVVEVAAKLRVGKSTVYAAIKSGKLPACRFGPNGKAYRIRSSDLSKYIDENSTTSGSEKDVSASLLPKQLPTGFKHLRRQTKQRGAK